VARKAPSVRSRRGGAGHCPRSPASAVSRFARGHARTASSSSAVERVDRLPPSSTRHRVVDRSQRTASGCTSTSHLGEAVAHLLVGCSSARNQVARAFGPSRASVASATAFAATSPSAERAAPHLASTSSPPNGSLPLARRREHDVACAEERGDGPSPGRGSARRDTRSGDFAGARTRRPLPRVLARQFGPSVSLPGGFVLSMQISRWRTHRPHSAPLLPPPRGGRVSAWCPDSPWSVRYPRRTRRTPGETPRGIGVERADQRHHREPTRKSCGPLAGIRLEPERAVLELDLEVVAELSSTWSSAPLLGFAAGDALQ
jgi:hypothetical protein